MKTSNYLGDIDIASYDPPSQTWGTADSSIYINITRHGNKWRLKRSSDDSTYPNDPIVFWTGTTGQTFGYIITHTTGSITSYTQQDFFIDFFD